MQQHPALQPWDEFNQRLQANVHPSDWVNPTPAGKYNLVVIGAGSAGLVTAFGAAGLGAKVALIENELMGGDCLNVGCVPSKCLLSSAHLLQPQTHWQNLGIENSTALRANFSQIMQRLRMVRAEISRHDSAQRAKALGVDLYLGQGRFLSPHCITVGEQQLHFSKAVIATGARATVPPIPGLADVGYFTNETIFTLTELPKRLVVIGAGPIGCELGQAMARLGSHVTLIEPGPQFLRREDPDAAAILWQALQANQVDVMLNSEVMQVSRVADAKQLQVQTAGRQQILECDAILVAVGRSPNVESLNLPAAGVAFDLKQGVITNSYMQTSARHIYACGDVTLAEKFTHMADASARLVLANALFAGRQRYDHLVVPWCTYTAPEIAQVGLSVVSAKAQNIAIETINLPMSQVDRALTAGEVSGFVKIHLRPGSDTILGATIVDTHAGELISEVTTAMVHKLGLSKLAKVIHPYPTRAEAIRKCADQYNRRRLTPLIKRLMQSWLSWQR